MLQDMEFASGRLLVKSRVRLDCTALLLHRSWWSGLDEARSAVSLHLFTDSSPQWRGVELSACSVDIVLRGQLWRRLAPLVSLEKRQLGVAGKLAAILWQTYLMFGPTVLTMQSFARQVRSVTTYI